MSNETLWEEIDKIVSNYVQAVTLELHERWANWTLDLAKREMHEVIGGLLARQVTMAIQLAEAPSIWNGHIAPLILRSMTDNYINLAWIFGDPLERARKFILHGLGQEKLHIEHFRAKLKADGKDPEKNAIVQQMEEWLNTQRYTFLTEVNVGSWSGIDARKMAEEADCIDLYNYAYAPFSAATHNMWHHVAKYNLAPCPNPLHRYHKIPIVRSESSDIDYLYRAAKYVAKAFSLFDEKTGVQTNCASAFDDLYQAIQTFNEKAGQGSFTSGDQGDTT
jgi:hypothetical protein